MTNINDVKKCRDVLTHLKNTLPNCRFNFEIFQNERIFSNNIDTAISILDKLIARELVETEKEICICAAVKDSEGNIYRGHRHGDCMSAILKANKKIGKEQGFITSKNRFVDRKEGAILQNNAGIVSFWTKKSIVGADEKRDEAILFSEDLY